MHTPGNMINSQYAHCGWGAKYYQPPRYVGIGKTTTNNLCFILLSSIIALNIDRICLKQAKHLHVHTAIDNVGTNSDHGLVNYTPHTDQLD